MANREMDPRVGDALALVLGHGPPFTEGELADLETLVAVTGARDLSALAPCRRMRALHVHACEVADLDVLARFRHLESLRVTCSTVVDIAALAHCHELRELELAFNLIEDARPIRSLPALRRVVVLGNPLDEHSYHEVLAPLRDRRLRERAGRLVVEMPMQYDWLLTLELRDAGVGAVFDGYDDASYLIRPGITGPRGDDAEILQVPSSHVVDALTLCEIQGESLDWLHDKLFDSKIPRVAFPRDRQWMVGDALDAQDWIARASLPPDLERALLLLVRRFPCIQYARFAGEWGAREQHKHRSPLPDWYADILAVLASMVPGQPSSVRFDGFDHWSATTESLDRAWYQLGLITPMGDYQAVLDEDGYLTIAIWLETGRSNLAINVRDLDDRRIYEYSIEDVGEAGLGHRPKVVFESYASMLDHIRSVQIGAASSDARAEDIIERTGDA